ncbi:MAG TPA: GNAT family N-acetyltransferase [Candidatus Limnocylindria bacterium]|nr:GNAT family N-acetyltransferase [Candidatus Limnocylindria bacterium]
MGTDGISDAELARRLVLHEALAQQTPARELRDLGDGWLFHDPSDAEPFWNRIIAPRWPANASSFDRRLDEVITLFATIGRLPHVRPLPAGCEPPDMTRRLEAAGFDMMGADRRMVFVGAASLAATVADSAASVATALSGAEITISRETGELSRGPRTRAAARRSSPERRRWAVDASIVLAEAFRVGEIRRIAIENDVLACVGRPGCAVVLVSVDGEPAAIARRATTVDGSYLSSIGTRPKFQGRGLGALVTMLAVRDAIDAGSAMVHLAVEADNETARQLYERLGFAVVGDPAPDLLLH